MTESPNLQPVKFVHDDNWHYLIDDMVIGVNALHCACGVLIDPDCDVSSVSINEAFQAHLVAEAGPNLV